LITMNADALTDALPAQACSEPSEGGPLQELRAIVARLRAPGGCPWDREQTHASLRGGLLEEAYEVVEALDRAEDADLCEELGDLLLQVVMHCQIAAEEGRFDLDDAARVVSEKLVRRHPHVFGETKLADAEAVLGQWDRIKREEKGSASTSVLRDAAGLPALMRAEKMQTRAARVGFDWDNLEGVFAKIREELAEVEAADKAHLEDEIGDLLFSAVNLARKAGIDAEIALHGATGKFIGRFHRMEEILKEQDREFGKVKMPELDAIWEQVKREGRDAG
jgi:MazG family protein